MNKIFLLTLICLNGFALLSSAADIELIWNSYVSYKNEINIGYVELDALCNSNSLFYTKQTYRDTITWVTWDGESHTIISIDGTNELNSPFFFGTYDNNGTWSYTFNRAGNFKYYCSLHASMMSGEVTVIDPNAPVDSPVAEPVAAPVDSAPVSVPVAAPVMAPIGVEVPVASPVAAPVASTPTVTPVTSTPPQPVQTPSLTLPPNRNNNNEPQVSSGPIVTASVLLMAMSAALI